MALAMPTTYGVRPNMSPAPITIQPGTPTMIVATSRDGRVFRIEIRLGVLEVKESSTVNSTTGEPAFEIQFGVEITQRPDQVTR